MLYFLQVTKFVREYVPSDIAFRFAREYTSMIRAPGLAPGTMCRATILSRASWCRLHLYTALPEGNGGFSE